MKLVTALRCATMLALATPAAANAATIADTGTPTGGFGYVLGPGQQLAGQFTVGGATTITGVQGFIENLDLPGAVTATLYGPGPIPNAANVLFSTSFVAVVGEDWRGAAGLNWAVAAGTYWLGFSNPSELTRMNMRTGAPAPLGGYAYTSFGSWYRDDGLDIGIRVFGNPAGAIPEPATWALLILGFGAVGAGMRSRQRTQIALRLAI